jgi:hypothetical protein
MNDKVFLLHDEGLSAGKIAQKLKIKKAAVLEILGNEAKPKGFGDMIEAVTEATGIKAVVEAITDDCGCKARKEALNKLFPTRKTNDLSIEDFETLQGVFRLGRPTSVSNEVQKLIVGVYNRVFNAKRQLSNCSPCIKKLVDELEKVYNESK